MMFEECTGCGATPKYTVLLAVGPSIDDDNARYFIPNQHVREALGTGVDPTRQVPFCRNCMREVESALRGTIARLQQENGITPKLYAEV